MPYGFKDFAAEVGGFWYKRARQYVQSKPPVESLTEQLQQAQTFETWESSALELDRLLNTDLWRRNPTGKHFDARLIQDRLDALSLALETSNTDRVISLFRAGLVRNLGNITTQDLYDVAAGGTKVLIDQYIRGMVLAINYLTSLPIHRDRQSGLTAQDKMDLMHDARQAYGRTALLLQGGGVYGLSHFGVVKALHLRGLLPRIIVGHGVGALVAALVCIHKEEELLPFLEGQTPILADFDSTPPSPSTSKSFKPNPSSSSSTSTSSTSHFPWSVFDTLTSTLTSLDRHLHTFSSLSSSSHESTSLETLPHLQTLLTTHLGDLTFIEAYTQTKRLLNISASTPLAPGSPTLLNHITARDVVIRTAALASNTSPSSSPSPSSLSTSGVIILTKSPSSGQLLPWKTDPLTKVPLRSHRHTPSRSSPREAPLQRTAELFNVTHFLVSQPRPYLPSFIASLAPAKAPRPYPPGKGFSGWGVFSPVSFVKEGIMAPGVRFLAGEVQHRLAQADKLGLMPEGWGRVLVGEDIPGASVSIKPELGMRDYGLLARMWGGSWGLDRGLGMGLGVLGVGREGEVREGSVNGEGEGNENGRGGGGEGERKEEIEDGGLEYWILKGERAVWPNVAAIKVRCAIEVGLEGGYQVVRVRRGGSEGGSGGLDGSDERVVNGVGEVGGGEDRRVVSEEAVGEREREEERSRRRRRRTTSGGTTIVATGTGNPSGALRRN